MATVITSVGQEWISEHVVGDRSGDEFYVVGVGEGTTAPAESDTALQSEIYRANDSDSNCTVEATTNTGEVTSRITVSGGTEVPAGSSITELGLFTKDSDTLIYRETRNAVTIDSGDRKTFEFDLDVVNK